MERLFEGAAAPRTLDRRSLFGWMLKGGALFGVFPVSILACGGGDAEKSPPLEATENVLTEEPAAPAALPAASEPPDETRLVTEVPAAASIVTALGYVNQSPEAGKDCRNCQLYTPGNGGTGKCQLFPQGLVREAGWCASWIERVS